MGVRGSRRRVVQVPLETDFTRGIEFTVKEVLRKTSSGSVGQRGIRDGDSGTTVEGGIENNVTKY